MPTGYKHLIPPVARNPGPSIGSLLGLGKPRHMKPTHPHANANHPTGTVSWSIAPRHHGPVGPAPRGKAVKHY